MQFKEKTICKNYVYKGKILSLRKDDVILPNGQPAIREMVEHSGGSAIYCEVDGKILLVKQYRYPYEKEIWEIPAGKLNIGESPEQTAIRELEEEGGIVAERVEKMFDVYPTPAYTNEVIRIYRAVGLTKSKQRLDDDEFLHSQWIDKEQVVKMIYDGEINDSKTIIAVLSSMK
ncbi:MAG: NUDIX hydrolase [Clostridiales bacterium]|nr:NUDIX hydrolase [Clostridiales bacterium]